MALKTLPNSNNFKQLIMKRAKEACKTLGLLILMSIFPIWAFAQNTVTITGLVTDDDGLSSEQL